MGKVEIRIPHCVWRDGRPRFVPGPRLRALGLKGRDLRHDSAGEPWFSLAEVEAWIRDGLAPDIARREAAAEAAAAGGRRAPAFAAPKPAAVYTVAEMVEDAKTTVKPLAPKSVKFYAAMERRLIAADVDLWATPAREIGPDRIYALYARLVAEAGPGIASGVMALLSRSFREAVRFGRGRVVVNPCSRLGFEAPPPRLRWASVAEIKALVAAADAIGRPEIGDAVVLGVMTGQRAGDRLMATREQVVDGALQLTQGKTGKVMTIALAPWAVDRLAAAQRRRAVAAVAWPQLVIDERIGRPFAARLPDGEVRVASRYNLAFRAVVAKAIETTPALAGMRDQDLRDTCITWLADAGATSSEICSVSGHEEAHVSAILKHYRARTRAQSQHAVDKLATISGIMETAEVSRET